MLTRTLAAGLLALASLVLAAPARAGDEEAKKLLKEATQHWNDPEPDRALELLEEALAAEPGQMYRNLILLTKARLVRVKVGDNAQALQLYDQVIRGIPAGELLQRTEELKQAIEKAQAAEKRRLQGELAQARFLLKIKSDAMVDKANLIYSEESDAKRALQLYIAAGENYPQATTFDIASQFCYRVGQDQSRPGPDRAEFLKHALELAQEALRFAEFEFPNAQQRRPKVAKYQLQLALVRMARDEEEQARAAHAEVDQEALATESLYQQALWQAHMGEPDAALDLLKQYMQETRPTVRARNDLRKFTRNEPVFKPLVAEHDAWKAFVEDEPDNG